MSNTPLTDALLNRLDAEKASDEQGALALISHAQQLEEKLTVAVNALKWIVTDAIYKAPEQYGDPATTSRWVTSADTALKQIKEMVGISI